ncbi:hypothetical protein KFL_000720190 [Klebsormidium nitens]|uniref:MBD domain-containing protein n=1 Tax=Klebsormidium nitens TaxID=105231 RepID=A0A1Y1HRA0_KLENI|nr:hypothetical protein KFL_000720190 [Klebsormidium nitens]|eukprot:GAQ81150.1 hypothetical protein KFL_000720190 [Klebsormidium nitens]
MENAADLEPGLDGVNVAVMEEHYFAGAVQGQFTPASQADGANATTAPDLPNQGPLFPAGDESLHTPAASPQEEFHPALDEQEFEQEFNAAFTDHVAFHDLQPGTDAQGIGVGGYTDHMGDFGDGKAEQGHEGELDDGGAEAVPEFEQGVARGTMGVGWPFAPAGWQWRVAPRSRLLASGHYADVHRTPPNGRELHSMKQVERYLREELGLSEGEVQKCMDFEARIPATRDIIEAERAKTPGKKAKSAPNASLSKQEQADEETEDEGAVITPQNVVYEEEEDEEEAEDESVEYMLDEFLKSPENWASIGWRLRGPEGRNQQKRLLAEARARDESPEKSLKRLKLRVLKFPAFLRSEELEALPHSLLTLVTLVMTEGVVYEAKSRRMLNGELVLIVREQLTKHQKAAGLDELGVPIRPREKKVKKENRQVQTDDVVAIKKRKHRPSGEEEPDSKRKRKSLNDLPEKPAKGEPHLVNRVIQLKPSLSGLSVEVDGEDPEEETVEQPMPRLLTPEATTDALNAALEAAAETPTGAQPEPFAEQAGPAFGSPLFFADQSLGEEACQAEGTAQQSQQEAAAPMDVLVSHEPPPAAPAPPPVKSAPMTVEQLEIIIYRKKLVKLERKRRGWAQAFEQKLATYRKKREELEGQLEKRRADQEAQKIQVVEDTERLREARAAALQEMKALQAAASLSDIAEQELEKRGAWEPIYTAAVDEVKKAKKKAWEEVKKGVGEVKKSNLEQMRKKVDAYKQLGMALPQAEIDQEREQYTAEITEMQAKLEAQKVLLDAEVADLEQKMAAAKAAYNDYKAQHKKLEREESRLQQLLQEPIP